MFTVSIAQSWVVVEKGEDGNLSLSTFLSFPLSSLSVYLTNTQGILFFSLSLSLSTIYTYIYICLSLTPPHTHNRVAEDSRHSQ